MDSIETAQADQKNNTALMTEALMNLHIIANARGTPSFDIEEPVSTAEFRFWQK